MNGKIGMRALSALFAILLVSVTMVPAVAAYSEAKVYEDALGSVEIVRETASARESYVTVPHKGDSDQKFFVKEWKDEVDGREVWRINVFEVDSRGAVANTPILRDSYYWNDSTGLHIHFGTYDMDNLIAPGGFLVVESLGAALAVILGLAALPALALAVAIAGALIFNAWYYRNLDGSLDMYFSTLTLALIPVYLAMPGPQPIVVRLGSHDVPVLI
ncbi:MULTISPECIES: hypothetical protein [unclassified Methanoculleus]|mgnify:CR=1 FL=1|jgi:hypothetical protein|uniref:hypothetical protein n=2 Tax=Methanoculleus TaxID=45989 RepID=UPI00319DE584|nr:hypothetical protein [Methanoculleus sp.]